MVPINNKPTIEDVARAAGVSDTTVSFVLSGSKHASRISQETQDRVWAAAKQLGYTRNRIGTALQRGYSDNVVLLATTWEIASANSRTILAVSRAAMDKELHLVVTVAADDDEALTALDNLSSLNPYGLMLIWDSQILPIDRLAALQEAGTPVVDLLPTMDERIPSVAGNREQGTFLCTQHLTELGHKKIGMMIERESRWKTSLAKLAGYRRALETAGIPYDDDLIEDLTGIVFESGYEGFTRLYERRPDVTAVMSISDPIALGSLACAQDRGLRVPQDVSITGHGAHPEGVYSRPRLTTVAFPPMGIAERGIDTLVRARNYPNRKRTTIYADMELIVRESTGQARK